jgi:hypothetical protein
MTQLKISEWTWVKVWQTSLTRILISHEDTAWQPCNSHIVSTPTLAPTSGQSVTVQDSAIDITVRPLKACQHTCLVFHLTDLCHFCDVHSKVTTFLVFAHRLVISREGFLFLSSGGRVGRRLLGQVRHDQQFSFNLDMTHSVIKIFSRSQRYSCESRTFRLFKINPLSSLKTSANSDVIRRKRETTPHCFTAWG